MLHPAGQPSLKAAAAKSPGRESCPQQSASPTSYGPILESACCGQLSREARRFAAVRPGFHPQIWRTRQKKQQGEGTLDNVSYLRASILKAWLIRNHQIHITEMLDETNINPGYRLGRLFAVLEKTQQDALPGINSTIRDRFYSSASATPRSVFGRLLRTYQHHLGKLDIGAKIVHEKRAQEILAEVTDFPAHMNLKDQAQFALGYYHQRKEFFTKKETDPSTETESASV